MLDPKIFDDIAKRLSEAVPAPLRNLQTEMEKNFRSILQSCFAKLDLVTREEFDVQAAVLAKTRAKLEAIEQQLSILESEVLAKKEK